MITVRGSNRGTENHGIQSFKIQITSLALSTQNDAVDFFPGKVHCGDLVCFSAVI